MNRFPDFPGFGTIGTGWPWALIRQFDQTNPPTNGQVVGQNLKKILNFGPKMAKRSVFEPA